MTMSDNDDDYPTPGVVDSSDIYNVVKKDDSIYIYENKFNLVHYIDAKTATITQYILYKDFTNTKVIVKISADKTVDENELMKKYPEAVHKYKSTFKKNSKGEYYYYSTEPIEE